MTAEAISARLVQAKDGKIIQTHPLYTTVFSIGRSQCDVNLEEDEVSSKHCQIQKIGGTYHVFDLNSTNGTFLNDQRVLKARLSHGDVLKIGSTEFTYETEISEESFESPISVLERFQPPQLRDVAAKSILKLLEDERKNVLDRCSLILDIKYPDMTSEKIELKQKSIQIGRVASPGKFSRDEEISRKHASFKVDENGSVWVQDLGSTNGTLVNEELIHSPYQLSDDDVVRIGNTRVRASIKWH